MRKKTFKRMQKKVHEINYNPMSTPIRIKKLAETQTNYNPLLDEWVGNRNWVTLVETKGIIDAFKESEDWKEIGMLGVHDYKCSINDNLNIDYHESNSYIVERLDNGKIYEVIFYREFIGEVHIGLRPVISDEI